MNAYLVRMTPFGPVALAWQPAARGAVIHHVFLSTPDQPADATLHRTYPHAGLAANADVRTVAAGIRALLRGAKVEFDLDLVALDQCPPFQQTVLRATHGIPRGQVSTYGRIATQLGRPGAARAVGNALANNPFPLLIPCHRVVRAGGHLGGFGGGSLLKQALLALEGVETSGTGRRLAPPDRDHGRTP